MPWRLWIARRPHLAVALCSTEFAADFRSGHVEAGGRARLYVVILEDAPDIVVRVDTSDSLGLRLADRLASEPDAV